MNQLIYHFNAQEKMSNMFNFDLISKFIKYQLHTAE